MFNRMGILKALRAHPVILTVLFVASCLTHGVSAAPEAPFKAFAVFMVSYNTTNDQVRGGVAGSLFFVSPTEAITAYHVLQPDSFKPAPGFERVRVWVLHESLGPIEIKPEYANYTADKDLTRVKLPATKAVPPQYVFQTERVNPLLQAVETEGYLANTGGPLLIREGLDMGIHSVRKLQRLRFTGKILRQATVELNADDVKIKSSPNVQLSYEPIVGLSGGPVVSNGHVIAMNSFADPATRKSSWALELRPANTSLLNP